MGLRRSVPSFAASVGIALSAHGVGRAQEARGLASYREADGAVRIVGYNDMQELFQLWDQDFQRGHPGLAFDLELKSTRSAPPALAAGESLFAPMGAEMSVEQLAPFVKDGGRAPLAVRVAHASVSSAAKSGPIAIVVPASSPRERISFAELAEIFGETGSRAGLRPYGLGPETPLAEYVVKTALAGYRLGPQVTTFGQSREVVHAVAADPQGIGFASMTAVTSEVRVLAVSQTQAGPYVPCTAEAVGEGRYPLDRFLLVYLAVSKDGAIDALARDYLRFVLSEAEQGRVGQTPQRYIPLDPAERAAELGKLASAGP